MTAVESATCIDDDPEIRRLQLVEVVLRYCAEVIWPNNANRVKEGHETAKQLRELLCRKGVVDPDYFNENRGHASSTSYNQTSSVVNEVASANDDVLYQINGNEQCSCHDDSSTQHCSKSEGNATGVVKSKTMYKANGHAELHHNCKKGQNGLAVASADVIVCKNTKKQTHHHHHSNHADHCHRVNANGTSQLNQLNHCKSTHELQDERANTCRNGCECPCEEGKQECCGHDYCKLINEGTPATTLSGELVVVSECGSPYSVNEEEFAESLTLPLHVRRLSGGITNELFHVFDNADVTSSVVIRVFGKETERVISRHSELFYQSLFLPTYVHGVNFLVYAYLHAYTVLPYTEMKSEAHHIASSMAAFHVRATLASKEDLQTSPSKLTTEKAMKQTCDTEHMRNTSECEDKVKSMSNGVSNLELSERPEHKLVAQEIGKSCSRFDTESNYTIHSLTKWVDQIKEKEIVDLVEEHKQAEFVQLVPQLEQESKWMLAILERIESELGEGVCHNDLLSANIMRRSIESDESIERLKLIDFDYTKRNYLLFDIANHFNEYTGLECDYARFFPSDAHISEFIKVYRRAMREEITASHKMKEKCIIHNNGYSNSVTPSAGQEIICSERELFWNTAYDLNGSCKHEESKDITASAASTKDNDVHLPSRDTAAEEVKVARWTQLVKLLTLASHLSWSIWSLVQEAVSELDVDFLEYSKLRLARYYETRDEYSRDFVEEVLDSTVKYLFYS